MSKRVAQDGFELGQSDCRSNRLRVKMVILSGLKTGLGQSGCGLGWVGLTHIFHMNFFYYKFLLKKKKKHVFAIWKIMQQIT